MSIYSTLVTDYAYEHPLRVTLCFLLATQIAVVLFHANRRDSLKYIPMPGGESWIWGHERIIFNQSLGVAYSSWFKNLESYVIKVKGALWRGDLLVISDPLALAHIQQKNVYHYPRSEPVRRRIGRMLGRSFGWVEGESEHKRMRNLVAPAFSMEVIRASQTDIYAAVDGLVASLEKRTLADGGSSTLNIQEVVNRATLDVIGRFGFGHDFGGGFSEDGAKIINAWNNLSKLALSPKGFMAIHIMGRFPFINELPLEMIKRQGDIRATIHKGVGQELLRRQKGDDEFWTSRKDLLSQLVCAVKEDKITEQEMLDHISMIIMAGYETTAQTVCYALWELAKSPLSQAKLREECRNFVGEPSWDDFQTSLPFLDACFKETLRVHPAVPNLERVSDREDVIPLRNPIIGTDGRVIREIHIDAGQIVVMPIHTINRQDSVWGDGAVFRPERWMQVLPPQEKLTKGWGNTLAFSDGSRNCVGYKLAIFESKALLFTLVKEFMFHDTGARIIQRLSSSLQALVVGEEEKGPQIPIIVTRAD